MGRVWLAGAGLVRFARKRSTAVGCCARARSRRTFIAGAALMALVTAGSGQVHASAGCDAVNAGGFNVTVTATQTIAGFAVGDTITFTQTNVGAVLSVWQLFTGNGTSLFGGTIIQPGATALRSYTVTGSNQDTTLVQQWDASAPGSTATCTPAPRPGSDRLRGLQIAMTKLAAEASGSAITNAVDGGINGAFSSGSLITVGPNGITFNFTAEPQEPAVTARFASSSALAFAPPTKALRRTPMMEREWSLWADVRGTSWDRNTAGAHLDGRQLNVTAGLGRKVRPDLVVGLLAGFEDFRYDAASLTGTMKGDGGTVGGYAGWKIAPHLRWDAMLAWSALSYDAVAGTASGSFNGSRWLASSGLTGRYHWTAFIFEPSARIYALWEHEDAYTDSLGTLQGARSFSVGRVSAGGRVIYPSWMRGDVQIAPYLGLYGDYRFSSDAAVPVGQPVLWVGDGLSARVTGGVTAGKPGGGSVAIGGEVGGLGASYNVWSLNGRVFWPF